ncbi:MAG: DNA repair protein RadA [Actinomycetota bacterium]|nr:DNA repair protein RadA [Actinomycetota bacterium]
MARAKTVYRCSECGAAEPKWAGRCSACEAWDCLVEERVEPVATASGRPVGHAGVPIPIAEVDTEAWHPIPTGVDELDRVLQGGLVPGSVTLVAGEPGIGKSTLLLQALVGLARSGRRCLYVSAEESAQQVRLRAERLDALAPELWLVADTVLPHIVDHLDAVSPSVVVVDSIQTVHDPALASAPGSVAQVRDCAHRLVREAKDRGAAVLLVGHVTKDGGLAGPRVLEHLVDTVLSFEGERHHALRLLRATKHRFGSIDGLGLFAMTDKGLEGVPDPSALFLADRQAGIAGSVIAPVLDGHRPLLVEVQALVTPSNLPSPRRSAQGLDSGRLSLALAVLATRAGAAYGQVDVHAVVTGGVKVVEPGADLARALALVSSREQRPVAPGLVACGEVGLGGELRQVHQTARRLAEAARLGFTTAIVPASAPADAPGIRVLRAATLGQAIDMAGLRADHPSAQRDQAKASLVAVP